MVSKNTFSGIFSRQKNNACPHKVTKKIKRPVVMPWLCENLFTKKPLVDRNIPGYLNHLLNAISTSTQKNIRNRLNINAMLPSYLSTPIFKIPVAVFIQVAETERALFTLHFSVMEVKSALVEISNCITLSHSLR